MRLLIADTYNTPNIPTPVQVAFLDEIVRRVRNHPATIRLRQVADILTCARAQAVLGAMRPGVRWPDMHLLAERALLGGLKSAGIVRGSIEEMLNKRLGAVFMPHGERGLRRALPVTRVPKTAQHALSRIVGMRQVVFFFLAWPAVLRKTSAVARP